MISRMLFAGSGGQGVLTIGNILGNAAMLEDYHVTFLPEYGAAMRGGTANCTLCISDEEIASPVASEPDVLLSMNQLSVATFINRIHSGGRLLYNSSIVDTLPDRDDIEIFSIPANDLALTIHQPRSANMVILGALIKLTEIIPIDSVQKSIDMLMGKKKKVAESSIMGLRTGYDRFSFSP